MWVDVNLPGAAQFDAALSCGFMNLLYKMCSKMRDWSEMNVKYIL